MGRRLPSCRMERAGQLVLVPGMGTDPRLYRPQRAAFPELISPEWLMPEPRESLVHYGERLAEGIKFDRTRPVVVGGVSLGGMLALEMAERLGGKRGAVDRELPRAAGDLAAAEGERASGAGDARATAGCGALAGPIRRGQGWQHSGG